MGILISKIYSKGLMNDYGYKYYSANKGVFEQYKSADDFAKSFRFNEEPWKFFEGMAMADTIDLKTISEKEKAYLYRILKASIARQLWRNEGYFEVSNEDDNTVKKALELLGK